MLPLMPLCGSSPSISTLSGCPQTPSSYTQVPVNFCLSASQTYSQGQTTYMWQPRGPKWSVKFPIASPCIWSLSVSSNSCLKTLIILNFPQSVWKLLQENSELENFPEIFQPLLSSTKEEAACGLTGHFGLTRSLSFMLCSSVGIFLFENNEFQRSLFSQLWPRQTPLLPLPMTSSTKALFLVHRPWDFQNKLTMPSLFSDAQEVMVWSNNSPSFWNVMGGIFLDF